MANYDFTNLSAYDFEDLVRDLLQEELQLTLECFKSGRDSGIDLRYSREPNKRVIVQCKHYSASGYSQLYNRMKQQELKKIQRLKPYRYILATSVGLTPQNKEELKALLTPYCLSPSDIYGKDDLNNLINLFPKIEKRNFKLWLTSQTVLERILNNSIFAQTEFEREHITKKLRFYVQNESFVKAINIIDEANYCIISGIPGIGKTTLAEILLVHFLSLGFSIIKISSNISEAFSVYNSLENQVFYYDDFLGQTSLEHKINKNEEHDILRFIESIKSSKNKKFILTTREYILNQAKAVYEKFYSSNFDVYKYVINLSDYTKFDRAKILFNHVYFSGLSQDYKNSVLQGKNYMKVVNHPNFNPRIIEWMTIYLEGKNVTSSNYISEFIKNLENPIRIWEHAFINQISIYSRYLLLLLWSLPDETLIENLEQAFLTFCNHKQKLYFISYDALTFRKSLRELEGNFIISNKVDNFIVVKFHNPSIKDFIANYLLNNVIEIQEIYETVLFFEQWKKLWDEKNNFINSIRKDLKGDQLAHFSSAVKRTFKSESCRLDNVMLPGKGIVKMKSSISLEERAIFFLDKLDKCGIVEAHSVSNWIVEQLVDSLTTELFVRDGEELLQFIVHVDANKYINEDLRQKVIALGKSFFIESISAFGRDEMLDGFIGLGDFHHKFPTELSNEEIDYIVSEFLEFVHSEAGKKISEIEADEIINVDGIKEFDSEVRKVASKFGLNIQDFITEIEDFLFHIDELQAKYMGDAVTSPGDEMEYYLQENKGEEEIDSLFEILREA